MSKWHFSSVYFWPPEPMGQKLMISFCCFELKLKKLSFTVLYQMARRPSPAPQAALFISPESGKENQLQAHGGKLRTVCPMDHRGFS